MQEIINNWEREREREREREKSLFLEENVREITNLYKRIWVEKHLKENVYFKHQIIQAMLCNRIMLYHYMLYNVIR